MMQAKRFRSLEFGYANTEDDRSRVSCSRAQHRMCFPPSIRAAGKQVITLLEDRPMTD
jgi:hypothetical protein